MLLRFCRFQSDDEMTWQWRHPTVHFCIPCFCDACSDKARPFYLSTNNIAWCKTVLLFKTLSQKRSPERYLVGTAWWTLLGVDAGRALATFAALVFVIDLVVFILHWSKKLGRYLLIQTCFQLQNRLTFKNVRQLKLIIQIETSTTFGAGKNSRCCCFSCSSCCCCCCFDCCCCCSCCVFLGLFTLVSSSVLTRESSVSTSGLVSTSRISIWT